RYGVSGCGPLILKRVGLVVDRVIRVPDARADAFGELPLERDGRLHRVRLLEVRIDEHAAGESAGGQRTLLARLERAVEVRVGPVVSDRLQRLVGVRAVRDADAGVELVLAAVRLQHGLAVALQVDADAEARDNRIPFQVMRLRERLVRNT